MSWIITGEQKVNWDPSLISTALWLDAADASTITESGGAISQWDDKSGNGRHAIQSITAERPLYDANAVGGKYGVLFDGSDDGIIVAHDNALNMQIAPSSIFIVYRQDASGTGFRVFQKKNGLGVESNSCFASPQNFTSVAGAFGSSFSPGYTAGNATIQSFIWNGTTFSNWIGGALATPGSVTNGTIIGSAIDPTAAPATNADPLYIGRRNYPGGTQGYLHGHICELIFANSEFSQTVRQKLEGYLAHKWGLTANLPADHPYKTAVPVP